MSSEVLTQLVGPGQPAAFGQGRIFNLLSAIGGPVTITCDRRSWKGGQSQPRVFAGVPAGTKFVAKEGDEWTYLRVTSTVLQTITIFIGDEDLQFNNAVTVTGTAAVTVSPAQTLTASAALVSVVTATAGNVPANVARRRITVACPITNTGPLYAQSPGAALAGVGIPIQPGQYVEFDAAYAFDLRNDSGATQKYSVFEES